MELSPNWALLLVVFGAWLSKLVKFWHKVNDLLFIIKRPAQQKITVSCRSWLGPNSACSQHSPQFEGTCPAGPTEWLRLCFGHYYWLTWYVRVLISHSVSCLWKIWMVVAEMHCMYMNIECFTPGRMRSIASACNVCLSACSVKNHMSKVHCIYSAQFPVDMAWSYSGDIAVCYVHPVMQMRLFSHNGAYDMDTTV